jgi:hypothetical protein
MARLTCALYYQHPLDALGMTTRSMERCASNKQKKSRFTFGPARGAPDTDGRGEAYSTILMVVRELVWPWTLCLSPCKSLLPSSRTRMIS